MANMFSYPAIPGSLEQGNVKAEWNMAKWTYFLDD